MTERPNQSNHKNRTPAVEAVHSQLSGENLSNVSFRASDLHGTGTQRDVLEALLGLANESKPSIRIVAVAEIDRLLNQAPLSPTTQASVVRLIPNLTRSIQLSSDQGVMSDLIRIAGDMGKIAESDISVCKSSEPEKQRTAAIQRLAGAIVAKLYEPGSKISPIILDRSIVALGKFPETSAPLTHPLLEEVLKSQNLPQSVASARDSLKAVALQALTKEESAPKGRSTIAAWLNLHGLIGKARWSIAESEAVATLTSAFHTPPSFPAPIDSMETARISGHESRLRDAVAALNRFGVRSKGEMPFGASLQGAIALSSCLDSPLHDISALEALGRFGAHAEAAIPAILQVASSKRSSLETRGTALATLGEIFAKLPITELTAGDTLEGRFLDIATNALHGSNPHLIQRTLQSAITLGSKAAPLASAIDFALRENLQSTPLPGEAEEGALEPIALIAIEALAAIDPSGNIATASFDRIFRSPHTPDDIRLQLLLSVEELSEREEISIAIADAITARMIASPETPRYLLDEAFAMTERLEGSFGLHPADLPLSTTALLRSAQLDLNSKTEKLTLLVERAERHPNTVLTILMQAYKDISPYPRLDDIALATLRRLQKLSSR